MCMDKDFFKNVVTFTFHKNCNLGENFVESLKESYGDENVVYIDQSTYGIKRGSPITLDDVIIILEKAKGKGEKPTTGDEISLLVSGDDNIVQEKIIINPAMEYILKLNHLK